MKINTCPICIGNYYATEFSAEVCDHHQHWFVTSCRTCGRVCFSDCRGSCIACMKSGKGGRLGFNKDRRSSLRRSGLEDW